MANNQPEKNSDIPFDTPQNIEDILNDIEDLSPEPQNPSGDIPLTVSQADVEDILAEIEDIPDSQSPTDIPLTVSSDVEDILAEIEDIPDSQSPTEIPFTLSSDVEDILAEIEDIPDSQSPTEIRLTVSSDVEDILAEIEDIPDSQSPTEIPFTVSSDVEDILAEIEDIPAGESVSPPGIPLTVSETNTNLLEEGKTQPRRLDVPLLAASGLYKSFGGIKAVDGAEIKVAKGSITGLIGPNGAGKTTLFNLLSNFIRPDRGRVIFDGEPIQQLQPHQIAQMGMVRTFQVARVLSRLSVMENMLLAAQKQTGENFWNVWFKTPQIKTEERQLREEAMAILESVGLAQKANDYAGSLSGGQRKLLEMGRALMTHPQLILLDEPAAGVNPTLIKQICDRIVNWNREGMTFLIIEHNMDVIMSLCDRVWVVAEGKNLASGTPAEIQTNPQVLSAYLGQ
ncbi:ABC transporter-like protein [Microseira wollei NIES-4236]|uniref:ABC transporter-like protein n=1 Tax=Microseira wollei NIES-4236 TaxID=2530354 RepID=A0AAV3X6R6_9CYAN|nr:ABC transporter ATP-binding protein [Microseira wollei]GET36281.1 ABC transporter-like protein [Microseira wollei NIES-4236]